MATEDEIRRFEAKFTKGDPDDCWEWRASKISKDYGQFGMGTYAHRFSYELYVGPIPDGLFVLHRCDNPPCVNPNHLFVGSNYDNVQDAISKGRHSASRGSQNGMAKLCESDVLEIRRRYQKFRSNLSNAKQLAEEFGISLVHLREIVTRKQWKHI